MTRTYSGRSHRPVIERPLRVMFLITSMPVGGAETLLLNLVRGFDPARIQPQIACLKEPGVLGERLASEFPVHSGLIGHKTDVSVLWKLRHLLRREQIDAVITVGAGDKMFWGRLAARWAGVPVILSALHSTGWPDGVGRLNRLLTGITDGFIGVARSHGEFLVEHERFPLAKVFVIRNGIDTNRFQFDAARREDWRMRLGLGCLSPTVGIVAALRPEKNHRLFLAAAQRVSRILPECRFLIAGEGALKQELQAYANTVGIADSVHFLGNVDDTPGFLSAIDLFALTSDNEASPVSIVEAMACERPVVATQVGSVSELVLPEETGLLTPTHDAEAIAEAWLRLLKSPELRQKMGAQARQKVVNGSSLSSMVGGYTRLVENLFAQKTGSIVERPAPQITISAPAPAPLVVPGRFR